MRPARNRAVRAARQFNPCRERFCVCMSWHTFYFSQPENAGTWYADWLVSLSEEVVPRRQMSLSNIAGLRVFLLSLRRSSFFRSLLWRVRPDHRCSASLAVAASHRRDT